MSGEAVTINSRKFDQTIHRTWNCELVERDGAMLRFVGVFERDISHDELGLIARGTVSHEYYWLDRWYNIFAFYHPDGQFRNFYCNINMPPIFAENVLDYVDLDIDVIVWPDFRFRIVDEKEYERNAVNFRYPDEVRQGAYAALIDVLDLIKMQSFPVQLKILQQNP